MENQKSNLSLVELKLLSDLKEAFKDKELVNDFVSAHHVMNELEFYYGVNMMELLVNYRSFLCDFTADFENAPIISKAGIYMTNGNDEYNSQINNIACELFEENHIKPDVDQSSDILMAIDKLKHSKKGRCMDHINQVLSKYKEQVI